MMLVTYEFNNDDFEYEIDDTEAQDYLVNKHMFDEFDVDLYWERCKEEYLDEIKEAFEGEAYTMYLDTKLKDKDVYSYYGMSRSDFR